MIRDKLRDTEVLDETCDRLLSVKHTLCQNLDPEDTLSKVSVTIREK